MVKLGMTQKNSLGRKVVISASKTLTKNEQRDVEKLAYQFFVERGYQHGHDQEDWSRAEAIVRNRRS